MTKYAMIPQMGQQHISSSQPCPIPSRRGLSVPKNFWDPYLRPNGST